MSSNDGAIDTLLVAGTPDYVVAGVKQFVGTGLKLPVAWEIIGPDRHRSVRLIAQDVMPKL